MPRTGAKYAPKPVGRRMPPRTALADVPGFPPSLVPTLEAAGLVTIADVEREAARSYPTLTPPATAIFAVIRGPGKVSIGKFATANVGAAAVAAVLGRPDHVEPRLWVTGGAS